MFFYYFPSWGCLECTDQNGSFCVLKTLTGRRPLNAYRVSQLWTRNVNQVLDQWSLTWCPGSLGILEQSLLFGEVRRASQKRSAKNIDVSAPREALRLYHTKSSFSSFGFFYFFLTRVTDSFEKDVLFVRSLILKGSALGLIIIEKKRNIRGANLCFPWIP